MNVVVNKDNTVFNIIHKNGVQTSVKVSPSGKFSIDCLDRNNPIQENKNKYTVIVSSSKGCQLSCTFCHLTANNKQFENIKEEDIINNVMEAIRYVGSKVDLSSKYIKLCYMGEGEALFSLKKTKNTASDIVNKVIEEGLACGLDGIDISTTMPKIPKDLVSSLVSMNEYFKEKHLKLNPYNHNSKDRSIVRLFYSLHHYKQEVRDTLIPKTQNIDKVVGSLDDLNSKGVNVVTHYMFMNNVNDSLEDINRLVEFTNKHYSLYKNSELRILRFNSPTDNLIESEKMKNIINHLAKNLEVGKFKVQFSAGEDIKAACGMFL